MVFKEKLKCLRKINNMSQEELAEKLTVSRQTVSRWENGDSMPDAEMLIHLSNVFSVSVDKLLKDAREINDNNQIVKIENKNNKTGFICAACAISISVIVLLILCIFSSIFPVYRGHYINEGNDILYKATVFSFLDKYNLFWLFVIMAITFFSGVVFIVWDIITQRKRKSGIK